MRGRDGSAARRGPGAAAIAARCPGSPLPHAKQRRIRSLALTHPAAVLTRLGRVPPPGPRCASLAVPAGCRQRTPFSSALGRGLSVGVRQPGTGTPRSGRLARGRGSVFGRSWLGAQEAVPDVGEPCRQPSSTAGVRPERTLPEGEPPRPPGPPSAVTPALGLGFPQISAFAPAPGGDWRCGGEGGGP